MRILNNYKVVLQLYPETAITNVDDIFIKCHTKLELSI